MKTATKSKASDVRKAQIEKDRKRAEELSKVYAMLSDEMTTLQREQDEKLEPFRQEYDRKIKPVVDLFAPRIESTRASLEACSKELLEIGARQRKTLFNVKDNWPFENGYYLHAKGKTEVVTGPAFDLPKFVRKFARFVDVKFKVAALIKLFTNADERKRSGIEKFDIDLKTTETLEIKQSKNEQEEQ